MTDNQERPFGVTGAALAASIEESAARDPTGVDLWLQALKQPIAQTAAYRAAQEEHGGTVPEQVAVKIAAQGLRRAVLPASVAQLGGDLMRGVVAAKTYAHSELLWTEESIRRAIEDALTSEEAYLALKFMCLLLSSRFDELPELKAWHVRMLAGPESRPKRVGPKPHLNDQRDLLITREVEQLRVVGFRPTRNAQPSATRVRPCRLSGCEVVQMALRSLGLEMSYKAIEVVWTKNRRKIRSS